MTVRFGFNERKQLIRVFGSRFGSVPCMLLSDRRLTERYIAQEMGMSQKRVHAIIINDLGMTKVSAKWVPKLLGPHQRRLRRNMSRTNLALFDADPERFVTMDKTWVHHFQPETKQQSKQWKHHGSPAPKKAKSVISAGKVMVSVFRDSEGVLLIDYLSKGQTVTGSYYANLLRQLRQKIKENRREKLSLGLLFHQENVPAHKSAVALAAIHDCGFQLVEHPSYSPDLVLSDYYLFPKLKSYLCGNHLATDDDVIIAVNEYLEDQTSKFYEEGTKKLHDRWTKCVDLEGNYVEK